MSLESAIIEHASALRYLADSLKFYYQSPYYSPTAAAKPAAAKPAAANPAAANPAAANPAQPTGARRGRPPKRQEPVEVAELAPVEVAEPEPVEAAELEPVEVAELEPVEATEPEPVEVAEPEPVEPVAAVETTSRTPQEALVDVIRRLGKPRGIEILAHFGAVRLSEVPQARMSEFIGACDAAR